MPDRERRYHNVSMRRLERTGACVERLGREDVCELLMTHETRERSMLESAVLGCGRCLSFSM